MFNFRKNPIVIGTILLSFSGLLCRGIGFFYRLFISQTFGEEAMGIFQLTSPIIMMAFSLTCAGTQTAISKYTASCIGTKNEALARKYLLTGSLLSISFALLYSLLIYGQSENISIYYLQEEKCAPLLRICALSFPFSALHSCFNGYFYGKKETKLPAFTQITEQLVRVGIVFFLYHFFLLQNKVPSIALTCVGMVAGEVFSSVISFLYYLFQNSTNPPARKNIQAYALPKTTHDLSHSFFHIAKQLLMLSLPLTFNRVIVNLLQSYEAISIPKQLKAYGYSGENALSLYGVLTGMAFSLVLFPSTFANSVSVLLLPTVSEASSSNNYIQIQSTIKKTVIFSFTFGFCFTFLFLILGDFCGNFLFSSTLAGTFIRQLSFLCPFLYLHITLSSILNGLKRTQTTLFINVFSLLIRLFFIICFIPQYGIKGYLWGLLLSELLSSLSCFYALRKYLYL